MEQSPEWFASELASGETDRVNDAIDRIGATSADELMAAYGELFESCRPVYESDDGYVRQAAVRFLRDAYPMPELLIGGRSSDQVGGYTLEETAEHRKSLVEFLLQALADDDGRVRRAAVDGFNRLAVGLDLSGLHPELRALVDELGELRAEVPESKREHVKEALFAVDRPGIGGSSA